MASMDPVIKAMAGLKRDLAKHVNAGATPQDKAQLLNFATNELEKIRNEVLETLEKRITGGTFVPGNKIGNAETKEFGGVQS